jgi:hypothetical protein
MLLPKAEQPISHPHLPRAHLPINPLLAITRFTYTALAPLSHRVGPNRCPNIEIARCLSTSRSCCRALRAERNGGAEGAAANACSAPASLRPLTAASKRSCRSILVVDQVRWAKGVVGTCGTVYVGRWEACILAPKWDACGA